jgi:hypothetical protein
VLICPRPLLIQAGSRDDAEHRNGGVPLAPQAAAYYCGLGRGNDFHFRVVEGVHEFEDASACNFVKRRLWALSFGVAWSVAFVEGAVRRAENYALGDSDFPRSTHRRKARTTCLRALFPRAIMRRIHPD